LAVMLYEVSMEEAVSPEILGHLTPHLSALLLLSDGNFERMDAENQELVDSLVRRMDKIPLVVGVRCKDNNLPRVREDIFRRGMYLSEKGRLFFWNPEVRKSQTHLLTHLWSILQHSTILPSEMEEA
ncbi:MAG: hypothetical protein KDI06_18775, partial [Calditrichaeota bacterium]|nr:hypothetical protein [Calditrichota bacterium]